MHHPRFIVPQLLMRYPDGSSTFVSYTPIEAGVTFQAEMFMRPKPVDFLPIKIIEQRPSKGDFGEYETPTFYHVNTSN